MSTNTSGSIQFVKNYIDDHQAVLDDPNKRAVFGVGVCVGIILEIQKKEFKNIPFWNRLNRLDISISALPEIFTDTKNKLHQYRQYLDSQSELQFDEIFSHLGSKEISNLGHNSNLSNAQTSFIFSIGLSVGYFIYNKKTT